MERIFASSPETDDGNGGGSGGGLGGNGGGKKRYGGGGDGDDGFYGPFNHDYNKNTLTANEKEALRSEFAQQCIDHNLPDDYIAFCSPTTKMNDFLKVRAIVNSDYFKKVFKTAYDVKTKRIQFYCCRQLSEHFAEDNKVGVTFANIKLMSDHSEFDPEVVYKNGRHDDIFLNYDALYVRDNLMIDNEEITLS